MGHHLQDPCHMMTSGHRKGPSDANHPEMCACSRLVFIWRWAEVSRMIWTCLPMELGTPEIVFPSKYMKCLGTNDLNRRFWAEHGPREVMKSGFTHVDVCRKQRQCGDLKFLHSRIKNLDIHWIPWNSTSKSYWVGDIFRFSSHSIPLKSP